MNFSMEWTQLPSLNGLRAFSVVAETGSFSGAAAALNVSQAAVSQQVKALEERLGISLVIRQGRGIALTEDGTRLSRDLDLGFAAIRRGVESLTTAGAQRPVQITTSPAFAVEWLMPRIVEFQQQHPEITLLLNPTAEVMELRPGGIDLAVRYSDRNRLDRKVTPALVSDMVVIGTPDLIESVADNDPESLMTLPWLQELGTNEVADWFQKRGVGLSRPLMITQMPGNLIMQAVRRGNGISYTARAFFKDDIRSGKVVVLHSEPAVGIYYIETSPGVLRPAVKLFASWLKGKAERVVASGDAA